MKGVVIKSTGSWYKILFEDKSIADARLRGVFKNHDLKLTNPIAVGDYVEAEKEEKQETYIIKEICPRENYFVRKSSRNHHNAHIIASNLDLALFIVSLKKPRTSTGIIDRFTTIIEKHHIPCLIVLNKIDLLKAKDLEKAKALAEVYESIGYKTVFTSTVNNTGVDELSDLIKGKTVMLAGHSGVGKSTLVNTIYPTLDLRIGEISAYTNKGTHTTTFAEMHIMEDGTRIVDTPGIKEVAFADIDKDEICHYFPEMTQWADGCKFNNCTHVHEPKCVVLEKLEEGQISEERYKNYLSMLEDD